MRPQQQAQATRQQTKRTETKHSRETYDSVAEKKVENVGDVDDLAW